jgi:hypothetical protein
MAALPLLDPGGILAHRKRPHGGGSKGDGFGPISAFFDLGQETPNFLWLTYLRVPLAAQL